MPTLIDRFRGCLLGHAIGDALGAPYEGLSTDLIYRSIGDPLKLVRHPPIELLVYTDDTEMAIALASSLLVRGHVDDDHLAASFGEHFDPRRGYGASAKAILQHMAHGGNWQAERTAMFPDGSYGNGAAMRVPPVALAFGHDVEMLCDQTRRSAMLTHLHPLAIEGATLLALAIARLLHTQDLDRSELFAHLLSHSQHPEFRSRLETATQLEQHDTIRHLGMGLAAHESVVTAATCFALHPTDYEQAIARAIELGGDTDTIAAMAGALSGAYLGIDGIPPRLLDMLENRDRGREYIDWLARQLFERFGSCY